MADREKLIRCLKYCATTTDGDHHCGGCERWECDCGSSHCVDDLMLQAAEALEQQKWIPVTERLPQEDEPLGATCEQVQVLLADGTVTTGWCNRFRKLWYHLPWGDTHFYAYPYEHTPVIAWQPLAEPPKGE